MYLAAILSGLVLTAVIIAGALFLVRRLAMRRLAGLRERYPEREVIMLSPTTSLIGRESPTQPMLRGNGSLVLTRQVLVFELWLPRREILISRHKIRAVGAVDSFAGKSIFKPLLKIDYTGESGESESMALYVPELDRWIKALSRTVI